MKPFPAPFSLVALACSLLISAERLHGQIGPGQALRFDGVAVQAQVSPNALLTLSNQVSFEAWINPQKQDCNTILSSGTGLDPATDLIFDVGWNGFSCGGEMKAGLCIGGWYYSQGTVPVGAWSHVAVTCDGTNVRFYINGVLDSTSPQTTTMPASATPVYLGRQGSDCNCNFFLGPMDELRVWSTARTGDDIRDNLLWWLDGNETGLLAYYRFDEGGGATAVNSAVTGAQHD